MLYFSLLKIGSSLLCYEIIYGINISHIGIEIRILIQSTAKKMSEKSMKIMLIQMLQSIRSCRGKWMELEKLQLLSLSLQRAGQW